MKARLLVVTRSTNTSQIHRMPARLPHWMILKLHSLIDKSAAEMLWTIKNVFKLAPVLSMLSFETSDWPDSPE